MGGIGKGYAVDRVIDLLRAAGVSSALIDAGSKLGPSIGTLLGGLLLATVGWRMFFVVLGVVSLRRVVAATKAAAPTAS